MSDEPFVHIDSDDLAVLVAVALGTVERRRKPRQSQMTVAGETWPLAAIEMIAQKYAK